jgi:hypothetical protein
MHYVHINMIHASVENEENVLYTNAPDLCIFFSCDQYQYRLKQKLSSQTPFHDHGTSAQALEEAVERCCGRSLLRLPRDCSDTRNTPHARGEAETTHSQESTGKK